MTLGVMVVTPFGVVLSSDSLVSSTIERTEVIDPSQMGRMRYEDMRSLWPNLVEEDVPPPYILDPRNIREERKIVTTSSDVKKIFQVADFPIGLSFAGEASITYSSISRGGGRFEQAPIETFVSTIVKDVIKSRFSKENYNVHDIGECLSLALSTGFIAKEKQEGINFEIVGGGFSSDNVFPLSFTFNLNKWKTGGDRATLLGSSNYLFNRALLHTLPTRASSRNWFEDFLKNDLPDCVELSLCSAWWHALTNQYEKEVIERRIIPEVNQMICSNVAILGGILSENPMLINAS